MFVHVIPLCYVVISTSYLLRTVDLRFRRTLSRGHGLEPSEQRRVRFALISAYFAEIKAPVQGLKTHAVPLGVATLRFNQLVTLPNI